MRLNSLLIPKHIELISWVAPAVGIPALRYLNDSRDHRNQFFLRDASTYVLGAGIFFGTKPLIAKLLQAMNLFKQETHRQFAAFLVAITANILYAGIGAVKISQWYARHYEPPAPTPSAARNPAPGVQPHLPNFGIGSPALSVGPSPRGFFEQLDRDRLSYHA